MKPLLRWWLILSLALAGTHALAEELLMVRSSQTFEEAMNTLQAAIAAQGYKVMRVQRVDIGLTAKGYKTDKYRIVFFGKAGEIEALASAHPQLIPYLPLSVVIFAEEGNTLLATARPGVYETFYPAADLKPVFRRWEADMVTILETVRAAR